MTTVNTIAGAWPGRTITLAKYDAGSVSFTGGNMRGTYSLSQGGRIACTFDTAYWNCQ